MPELTPERLAQLRAVAEAATPGPWAFPHQKDPYGCYLLPLSENNASYIAVFDPKTALSLLDRIEALEQERDADRYRQQYEALRAGVERVAQNLLRMARTAMDNWELSGVLYYDGQADAFGEAEQMVRRLLD